MRGTAAATLQSTTFDEIFAHSPSSQAASACHVNSALSDNVAYTFTNGTDYPLNTNPASNAYAIAPASCQVSRASP